MIILLTKRALLGCVVLNTVENLRRDQGAGGGGGTVGSAIRVIVGNAGIAGSILIVIETSQISGGLSLTFELTTNSVPFHHHSRNALSTATCSKLHTIRVSLIGQAYS